MRLCKAPPDIGSRLRKRMTPRLCLAKKVVDVGKRLRGVPSCTAHHSGAARFLRVPGTGTMRDGGDLVVQFGGRADGYFRRIVLFFIRCAFR